MASDPLTPDQRDALSRVVCVGNAKGGVAKTSLSVHLAGLCAAAGWRVLLVDLDPQGSCGHALVPNWPNGVEGQAERSDFGKGIRDAVDAGTPLQPHLRQVRPNLDFASGGSDLKKLADTILGSASRGHVDHTGLARALVAIQHEYDLVVIDTPPSNSHLLQLALQAARWLVVPTKSDRFSIDGLNEITGEFTRARTVNESLELLGVALVATGTSATQVRAQAMRDIGVVFGGDAPIFEQTTRLAEAASNEVPIKAQLTYEIAQATDDEPPFYIALKEGKKPTRKVGSIGGLAEDYSLLVQEILDTMIARAPELADDETDNDVDGELDDASTMAAAR